MSRNELRQAAVSGGDSYTVWKSRRVQRYNRW